MHQLNPRIWITFLLVDREAVLTLSGGFITAVETTLSGSCCSGQREGSGEDSMGLLVIEDTDNEREREKYRDRETTK